MYFYLAQNGRFYQNLQKTKAFKNAQIKIIACFNEDSDLVIYDIKRQAGTELTILLNAVKNIIEYASRCKCLGTNKIILGCNKIPACYLRKIGFDTVDGCTLFNIG